MYFALDSALALAAICVHVAVAQKCEHQWEGDFADHEVDGVSYLHVRQDVPPPSMEIQPLIVNGPSSNRVDFLFLGDGYTEEERDKFFDDALTLASNMTNGQTFSDVLPLMNFWAAFTPSAESGIGVGGVPLDTVYGLYRDGTELRGVYYDKPEVARAACQSTETCDYPILLGNHPFYGGLGGTFTVTTNSPANGAAVLRHELGHSIIGVGEEYDGGQVYRGVNAAQSTSNVPWKQWYTNTSGEPDVQRSVMPIQAYPWTLLNATKGWSQKFNSAGTYDSFLLQFSISGVLASDDLLVELDGKDVGWEVNEEVGLDRWIYSMKFDEALASGQHEISFTLLSEELEGSAQLCNLEIVEYGAQPEEFNMGAEYHSLYPTFSASNRTTYRPTNDMCLMRTMHSPDFCDACIEGLWWSLLQPLSLIDSITQTTNDNGSTTVGLELLPLADFRPNPRDTESYTISWFDSDGNLIEGWANQTMVLVGTDVELVEVEVRFATTQVRLDPNGVLIDQESITVEKARS